MRPSAASAEAARWNGTAASDRMALLIGQRPHALAQAGGDEALVARVLGVDGEALAQHVAGVGAQPLQAAEPARAPPG